MYVVYSKIKRFYFPVAYLGLAGPATAADPPPPSALRKSRVEFFTFVAGLVVVLVAPLLSVGFGFCFSTMMKLSSLVLISSIPMDAAEECEFELSSVSFTRSTGATLAGSGAFG